MPKQVHRIPGLVPLKSGGYQARVSHRGFEESQNFRTKDDALRWKRNLKTDLERAPEGVTRHRKKWQATAIGPDGVETETFRVLNDAIEWLHHAKVLLARGERPISKQTETKFGDIATDWLSTKQSDLKSRKATYASQLRLHVLPHLGDMDIRAISSHDLDDWVQSLESQGIGEPTIRGAASAVRQILAYAVKKRFISKTPWVDISTPSAKRPTRARALTEKTWLALAHACGPYAALVRLLGYCGLRIGEATCLRKKHVDFSNGVIHVVEAWNYDASGKRYIGPTKNGEAREVPIPEIFLEELRALCSPMAEEDFLFRGEKGGPLNRDQFRDKYFLKAADSLGLRDTGVHMLRHTCASVLIRIGTPITAVSEILGHSNVEVTLKNYAHFYEEDSFAAMAKLSKHYESFTE